MKYKTLFRLILKVIGIYLLAESVPGLLDAAGAVFYWWLDRQGFYFGAGIGNFIVMTGLLGKLLGFAIGLYLLFGGRLIVNLCIPSNRPYCPECGYPLSHIVASECPECGVQLPARAAPAGAQGEVPPARPRTTPAPARPLETFIPYRNRPALVGYYMAIASFIPLVAVLLGPVAVTLGIQGLRAVRAEPQVKGTAHAWIAVCLGGLLTSLSAP